MEIIQLQGSENTDQFIQLIRLFGRVFETEPINLPRREYLTQLLCKEDYLVIIARVGDTVVGGLIAHVLDSCYSESAEVYLYDLAVETSYQRQGIGSLLLNDLLNLCNQKGFKEMFVQADLPDKQAIDFYLKNGGQMEEVVHFSYPVNKQEANRF